jgi:acetyl-CoA/propionyl-CoA carboxylase biotin carboxyl carrier protein
MQHLFFLDADTDARLRAASAAILRPADYASAATCEFLLGRDGTLAFLEVNPRLAVAHPVSEEITGLDLFLETFRIAADEPLGYGDPPLRGHALQFRIYAEDPGRGFAPARDTVRVWHPPRVPVCDWTPAPGRAPGSPRHSGHCWPS